MKCKIIPAGIARILRAIAVMAIIAAIPTIGCCETTNTMRFPNPLITDRDAADPALLRHGDLLYLYSTGCSLRGAGGAYPIRVSPFDDRTTWTSVGTVFTSGTYPTWAAETCKYWAPEVHVVGNSYICYFSTWDTNERFCIGAAISDSPEGPFKDIGKPLVSNPRYGLIDAGFFQDPLTSRTYLMWKVDGNGLDPQEPTDMLIQETKPDGITLIGTPTVYMTNDQEWEHDLVEAPSMIYRDGYYYAFFSANAFYDERYGVGVARSRNVLGPYEKYVMNPILKTNEKFDGPGHQFLFEESPGEWTMFYHSRVTSNDGRQRFLMSDPVKWNDDGWPYIEGGTPSDGWSPKPATQTTPGKSK